MAMEAYQFKENSGVLEQQPDGLFKARFDLAAYQGQTFQYVDKGVNSDNFRVMDVTIEGDETAPVTYHAGETPAVSLDGLDGLELVSKKDGKRKDGLSIISG